MKCNIKNFVKERNEALFSLDKEKLLNYCKKYDIPIPENELVFWAGVHKARLGVTSLCDEKKQESIEWLNEHGFKPYI